jgi:hypothetical protein
MSYKYGPSIVTDGLVFYVDAANDNSYPGSGTTWTDLAGSNDGTFSAAPTTDSLNGGSIVFDGVDDTVEGTGLSNGGGASTSQSYSVWFKVDTLNVSGFAQGLFFWAPFEGVGVMDVTGELYIQTSGDNSIGDFATTPTVSANTWCNVAFNFNQGASYECYVNSVSFGSVATSDTSGEPASSQKWVVGTRLDNTNAFLDYTNGNIAIVQAYNRALSASEITQNYNALKNRFI